MLTEIYNNVVGQRVIDGGKTCEDITSITNPTLSHKTNTISASGMVMDVDMPDTTRMEAMEFGISHNNGVNCAQLASPGKHTIEVRVVRQLYNVAKGDIGHESVKFRYIGVHKSTEKGTIETGNPYGSTEKYSIIRFEEIVNGKTTVLIDATGGKLVFNGVNYTDPIEKLLN